jgi:signal transduction histidine kinase
LAEAAGEESGYRDNIPVIDRLSALPALADIPREQLQWLLDHGEVHRAGTGATFRVVGDDLMGLFLLISGRFSVRVNQGGVERELREVTPGHATGYLPYSRMTAPRGYLVADGPVEFLLIRLEDLRQMTRECYEFTAACVQEMLARVRVFKSDDKRQEKMAALGRLSAGLAHELNNPASAAASAVRQLDAARAELVTATRDLGAAGLVGGSLAALQSLQSAARKPAGAPLPPLDRAELEDGVMEWLDAHRVDTRLAYALVERGLTVADLDAAVPEFGAGQLARVLRYLAADQAVDGLIAEISSATDRIHALVAAVKKHTHMDRAPAPEPIRLEEHLADTVTLMSARAALKSVSVELRIEADLPAVTASVADLNQVWMHLVDNAIDAVGEAGRIVIDARRDGNSVVVRIVDDGTGIPEELQERVFEPFFTTKDVGRGRGLGLDIVRSVVLGHRGAVELTSIPGRTEFRVTLPTSGGRNPDG